MSKKRGINLKNSFLVISSLILTSYFHCELGTGLILSWILGIIFVIILFWGIKLAIKNMFGK